MAKQVQDSKTRSDESRAGTRDITGRNTEGLGGSDAGVTNAESAPNDAAPLGMLPGDQPQAADDAPPVAPSPLGAEDPSRSLHQAFQTDAAAPASFPGFPKSKFHPVYGLRTVSDPNEEAALQPAHNWFDSAEAADAARTDREAQQVVHYNRRVKVDASVSAGANDGVSDIADEAVRGEAGIVRNSAAATESLKSGFPEPL